jgi:hypothetical protein
MAMLAPSNVGLHFLAMPLAIITTNTETAAIGLGRETRCTALGRNGRFSTSRGQDMRNFSRLLAATAMVAAVAGAAMAETNAFSGAVASNDFYRFIEEHSGAAVRLAAAGDVPADQMEKTDDAVFFWQANVQVGVAPGALQDDKIALDGCYRIRLADARQGVTAYFLDSSSDCE